MGLGRVPNGSGPWTLNLPTPGGANIAAATGNPANLRFNEWLGEPFRQRRGFLRAVQPGTPARRAGRIVSYRRPLDRTKHRIANLSFIGVGEAGFLQFVADGHSLSTFTIP